MPIQRKHALIFIVVLCLLAVVITGGWIHPIASNTRSTHKNIPRAAVAVARRNTVSNRFSIAGEFLPYQEVELHAKVAGYIRRINVDIGDRVRTGQVLAILEVPELNAQVEAADAGVRHGQEEILRAKQEVRRMQADYAAVHAAYERLQQASQARSGLIAQQELDNAMARDLSAEAQVEAAKSALSAIEQQLEVSKADRQRYSAMSDYSRITAPFNGIVTWRYADTGALIQAGTSNASSMPIVKLAQISVLRLRLPVPESLASSIHDGEPADIRVQATGDQLSGKVSRYTDSLDRSTRTMQVEIDIPNPEYKLQPGMFADVSLEIRNQPDALTIPIQAIARSADKTTVLIVDSGNRVQQREIQIGLEEAARVQVVSGLNDGERVIVGNFGAYQVGEEVEPRMSAMAEAAIGKEAHQ